MTLVQIVPIISATIAIASLAWAIFVTVRKGDITRATLEVSFGLTSTSDNLLVDGETKSRRFDRTTLILSAPLSREEVGIFLLFLGVRNGQPTAAKNVRVSLSFPADYLLRDPALVGKFRFDDKRELKINNDPHRTASAPGDTAQVIHDFPLLTPGEGSVVIEPMVFRARTSLATHGKPLQEAPLEDRLASVGVAGSFVLDVFVSAENRLPCARRFNVLWLNEAFDLATKQANARIIQLADGFWGGLPAPGVYLTGAWPLPRRQLFRWEGAEVLVLDLAAAMHGSQRYRVAEYEPVSYGFARLPMPTWNYHEDTRPHVEALRSPLLSLLGRWSPFVRAKPTLKLGRRRGLTLV
jgi:hypothetical protein